MDNFGKLNFERKKKSIIEVGRTQKRIGCLEENRITKVRKIKVWESINRQLVRKWSVNMELKITVVA